MDKRVGVKKAPNLIAPTYGELELDPLYVRPARVGLGRQAGRPCRVFSMLNSAPAIIVVRASERAG